MAWYSHDIASSCFTAVAGRLAEAPPTAAQGMLHVAGEEAVRSAFINVDQAGIGSLTEHQFEAALRQAGIELTRHQIISLHRRLAKDGKVQVEDVLRILI